MCGLTKRSLFQFFWGMCRYLAIFAIFATILADFVICRVFFEKMIL